MRCAQGPYFTEVNGYPASPKTIGEMIRKRRLDRRLRQADAAKVIGCDETTVVNWENGHRAPRVNHLAGVVKFLGFDPFKRGDTMAQRLVGRRKALGITQKDFARQIGVDPSTLARWERGEREPTGRFAASVESVLLTRTA
jgi:transcriptional regulator with XRE-family HTH domain